MKRVFFHSDLDGYVGGSILNLKYSCQFIECNYDNRIKPLEILNPGDEIILVDYSFLPVEMIWAKENCSVIWIDHHVSAIEDSKEFGYDDLPGIRKIGPSGAELSWAWAFPDNPTPAFVNLVGEYDTFRSLGTERFDKIVIPFFFGAEMFLPGLNPLNAGKPTYIFKVSSLETLKRKFIQLGRTVYRYKKASFSKINRESSYVRKIWGLRVLCLNTTEVGSLCLSIPETFDPEKHDMMLTYSYNGNRWSYGFYTGGQSNVDCSKIARMYGGGGHKGSAGASTKELIKEIL